MFEETNIKTCWGVKGDIDQSKAEANITFHTPVNLDIGFFVLLLFCEIKKVGLISLKQRIFHCRNFQSLETLSM